ncbi:hypothetical protein [Streptomyces sp. NBC_00829]|uniref:hypothetical protein n=1 Tax=Streptomyces sp. NBC_00829 TaxID=2903679 RepID=UPI00386F98E5|nr:hypothetical protein OG293_00295 [Streptomyces sp. NBC_00829]WTB19058.1 hypothetical protein OG293_39240 [Streptomyces sp. NBC_00829]
MEKEWQASVIVDDLDPPTDEVIDELWRFPGGTLRYEERWRRLYLVWRLMAPTLAVAAPQAFETAHEGLKAVLGREPELTGLRVITAEQANAERDYPQEQELMGYREAAAVLGVSRQRVAQLDGSHPDFPRPIGRIGAGPVFTAASVQSFAERWDRSPGRRRVA